MKAKQRRARALHQQLLASGLGVLGALGALAPGAALGGGRETSCVPATTSVVAPTAARLPWQAGVVQRMHLADTPRTPYFVYVPRRLRPGAPMVVSVHGISRNAREHAERFAPFAEASGSVLVAPLFSDERFAGYQRLQPDRRGMSPDALLLRIADEVAALSGADSRRLYLFGYSGGGQFVHRFTLAHPERVARYAVGAAGWYTFPDERRRFPLGLRERAGGSPGGFALDAFLRVPGVVLVGELDRVPDEALRENDRVVRQQGDNRFVRGRNWVAAVGAAARAHGVPPPVHFEALPGSPHSFARSMVNGGMGERVFAHFFGAADPAPGDAPPPTAERASPDAAMACIVAA